MGEVVPYAGLRHSLRPVGRHPTLHGTTSQLLLYLLSPTGRSTLSHLVLGDKACGKNQWIPWSRARVTLPSLKIVSFWEEILSCNKVVTDKPFCKSVNVGIGWSTGSRKDKPILGTNINLMLILAPSWWKLSNVIYLPPNLWMVPLGNGVISGSQCWSAVGRLNIQFGQEPGSLGMTE